MITYDKLECYSCKGEVTNTEELTSNSFRGEYTCRYCQVVNVWTKEYLVEYETMSPAEYQDRKGGPTP